MQIDLFKIGPLTVHGYGAMIALGIFISYLIVMHQTKVKGYDENHVFNIVIISIITGILGSKIFYVLLNIKELIKDPVSVIGSEGFVVYGGIIIGTLCGYLYCRLKNLDFMRHASLILSVVPLCQCFGRIGCFMAGCCYGKETSSSLCVVFPENSMAPAGVPLIPTQLMSSLGNFIIFCIVFNIFKTCKYEKYTVPIYLCLYSIGRFMIEFLRGDEGRGWVMGLSTSQFISIFILIVGIVLYIRVMSEQDRESRKKL